MRRTYTHIPDLLVRIAQTDIQIKSCTIGFIRCEDRIVRVNHVQVCSVKPVLQESRSGSYTESSSKHGLMIRILKIKLLVFEEPHVIIEEPCAHPVLWTQEENRHVCTHIHTGRSILEASHLHTVCSLHVQETI